MYKSLLHSLFRIFSCVFHAICWYTRIFQKFQEKNRIVTCLVLRLLGLLTLILSLWFYARLFPIHSQWLKLADNWLMQTFLNLLMYVYPRTLAQFHSWSTNNVSCFALVIQYFDFAQKIHVQGHITVVPIWGQAVNLLYCTCNQASGSGLDWSVSAREIPNEEAVKVSWSWD